MTPEEQHDAQEALANQDDVIMLRLQRGSVSDIQEALDETNRELGIRMRCFPKWVDIGKLTRTEARDRLNRLDSAARILTAVKDAMVNLPMTECLALAALTGVLALTGCQSMAPALHELAGDTNSVHMQVTSPWGTAIVDRNVAPTKP